MMMEETSSTVILVTQAPWIWSSYFTPDKKQYFCSKNLLQKYIPDKQTTPWEGRVCIYAWFSIHRKYDKKPSVCRTKDTLHSNETSASWFQFNWKESQKQNKRKEANPSKILLIPLLWKWETVKLVARNLQLMV